MLQILWFKSVLMFQTILDLVDVLVDTTHLTI